MIIMILVSTYYCLISSISDQTFSSHIDQSSNSSDPEDQSNVKTETEGYI